MLDKPAAPPEHPQGAEIPLSLAGGRVETLPRDPGGYAPPTEPPEREGVRNAIGTQEEVQEVGKEKLDNPWKRRRGGPSEEFEPEAWTPPKVVKR